MNALRKMVLALGLTTAALALSITFPLVDTADADAVTSVQKTGKSGQRYAWVPGGC